MADHLHVLLPVPADEDEGVGLGGGGGHDDDVPQEVGGCDLYEDIIHPFSRFPQLPQYSCQSLPLAVPIT